MALIRHKSFVLASTHNLFSNLHIQIVEVLWKEYLCQEYHNQILEVL